MPGRDFPHQLFQSDPAFPVLAKNRHRCGGVQKSVTLYPRDDGLHWKPLFALTRRGGKGPFDEDR